jgi:hypothetical protein
MKTAAPANMTAAERLAELTEILGRGVQRLFGNGFQQIPNPQNQQVRLAAEGLIEAPCGSRVLNPKSKEPAA